MPPDQRARPRRLGFRRSDHQHERGGKRDDDQRIMRFGREPLHDADRDRGTCARHGSRQYLAMIVAPDRLLRRPQPVLPHFSSTQTKGAADYSAAPVFTRGESYFRLVIAVRSAESLTTPAAPHQLEPKPPGLVGVMKDGLKFRVV